jgi:hypothetical protein
MRRFYLLFICFVACNHSGGDYNNSSSSNSNYGDQGTSNASQNSDLKVGALQTQKSQEEIRQELFASESTHPLDLLKIQASWRVNLIANTILEGAIFNKATLSGFKNVKVRAIFLSKTGVKLGEEIFLVMEFVKPSQSLQFRQRITGYYKDASQVVCEILDAEAFR